MWLGLPQPARDMAERPQRVENSPLLDAVKAPRPPTGLGASLTLGATGGPPPAMYDLPYILWTNAGDVHIFAHVAVSRETGTRPGPRAAA